MEMNRSLVIFVGRGGMLSLPWTWDLPARISLTRVAASTGKASAEHNIRLEARSVYAATVRIAHVGDVNLLENIRSISSFTRSTEADDSKRITGVQRCVGPSEAHDTDSRIGDLVVQNDDHIVVQNVAIILRVNYLRVGRDPFAARSLKTRVSSCLRKLSQSIEYQSSYKKLTKVRSSIAPTSTRFENAPSQ